MIVFTDYLTRYVVSVGIPNKSAPISAEVFVKEIICKFGAPESFLTDQGTNFVSELFEDVCKYLSIFKEYTTPYHPQTDGLVERFNHTLASMISMYVSNKQDDWDQWIPFVVFAYNSTMQSSLGETPHFLLYGQDPKLPIDVALGLAKDEDSERSVLQYKQEHLLKLGIARELARQNLEKARPDRKLDMTASM